MSARPLFVDARLPVWLDGEERPRAAYLIEGDAEAPAGAVAARFGTRAAHAAGCVCCAGRSEAAVALGRLFVDRARGSGLAFGCVVVRASIAGREAARGALATDAVAQARYRIG